MSTLRDVKIDLITENSNPIINLFNEITEGLEILNTNVHNDIGVEFIYHKNSKYMFYQDYHEYSFWCDYETYWIKMEEIGLTYDDIVEITHLLFQKLMNDRGWELTITGPPRMVDLSKMNNYLKDTKK